MSLLKIVAECVFPHHGLSSTLNVRLEHLGLGLMKSIYRRTYPSPNLHEAPQNSQKRALVFMVPFWGASMLISGRAPSQ